MLPGLEPVVNAACGRPFLLRRLASGLLHAKLHHPPDQLLRQRLTEWKLEGSRRALISPKLLLERLDPFARRIEADMPRVPSEVHQVFPVHVERRDRIADCFDGFWRARPDQ